MFTTIQVDEGISNSFPEFVLTRVFSVFEPVILLTMLLYSTG